MADSTAAHVSNRLPTKLSRFNAFYHASIRFNQLLRFGRNTNYQRGCCAANSNTALA